MSIFDGLMVVVALTAALWWAFSGDMVSAFVGPALGLKNGRSLDQIVARHAAIRSERRIAPKAP